MEFVEIWVPREIVQIIIASGGVGAYRKCLMICRGLRQIAEEFSMSRVGSRLQDILPKDYKFFAAFLRANLGATITERILKRAFYIPNYVPSIFAGVIFSIRSSKLKRGPFVYSYVNCCVCGGLFSQNVGHEVCVYRCCRDWVTLSSEGVAREFKQKLDKFWTENFEFFVGEE